MSGYTKIDMFGFADFYHRFSATGLTMEEMLQNYFRYSRSPRDIKDPIKAPNKVKAERVKIKPHRADLINILKIACEVRSNKYVNVTPEKVHSKTRHRELVDVRQWVSYVGLIHGFEPPDFLRILKWDRSGVYHKSKKCIDFAGIDSQYRDGLNVILNQFGHKPFNA